ncbi:MAG: CesT family type III secretion system chaperone [Phormidesmis sp. CAN_BIN36]|nr:CesT family type III secretion system chaperone [Phormidesmis sp. CAN_BIN36]
MIQEEIAKTLTDSFGESVQTSDANSYQVETDKFRVLVLLSDDQSWLRILVPIVPAQDAQPYLAELLEANFDTTQEVRYALHQEVLWGVFQHGLAGLTIADFTTAIQRLLALRELGIDEGFSTFAEKRIRQIIQVAKRQGQSLELTMKTLDRFYQEGMMGEMEMGAQSRENVLTAWQRQLERLWPDVEP